MNAAELERSRFDATIVAVAPENNIVALLIVIHVAREIFSFWLSAISTLCFQLQEFVSSTSRVVLFLFQPSARLSTFSKMCHINRWSSGWGIAASIICLHYREVQQIIVRLLFRDV